MADKARSRTGDDTADTADRTTKAIRSDKGIKGARADKGDKDQRDGADAVEEALRDALERSSTKLDRARRKAKRRKKARRRAERATEMAGERADRAQRRATKWKRRARAAENQVSVLQDLNRRLTVDYREDRAADAAALHFAAEAVVAFASDAVALRELNSGDDCSEYLDHLTFRLRQNLLETRSFLDNHGEVNRSAALADLLNGLPPDNTSHR